VGVAASLFGDAAEQIVAREEPAWRAWMDEHFPASEEEAATV
jgi:hypothetical protein